MSLLVENFLQALFTDNRAQAKEWRGANIPEGDDSNRTNLIRQCMTLEANQMKIRCLRKLRDQVAMNPFYQARLDRFVDAITDIYEPTDEQGTIPGNEFKQTAVGEDLKESMTQGQKETALTYAIITPAIIASAHAIYTRIIRKAARNCKGLSTGSKNRCMWDYKIDAIQHEINFLNGRISKCKDTKKPEKCKLKIKQRIRERTKVLNKTKQRYERWKK